MSVVGLGCWQLGSDWGRVDDGQAIEDREVIRTDAGMSTARFCGYDVTYHEFDGPHVVPPEIAQLAVDWLGWDQP